MEPSTLSLTSRIIGDVGVVYGRGRVVAGTEANQLKQQVKSMLTECVDVVLNFDEIDYIDSSGLGVLVTLCSRASAPNGQVVLCNLPEKVQELLTITKLTKVFEIYKTEAEAIYGLYGEVSRNLRPGLPSGPRLLCVDSSAELLAYLREVLHAENYSVLTALNMQDALLLLRASKFALVAAGPNFAREGASAVEALRAAAGNIPLITLRDHPDPITMTREIVAQIGGALSSKRASSPN
jgi:anti-sigma B factor antagonist